MGEAHYVDYAPFAFEVLMAAVPLALGVFLCLLTVAAGRSAHRPTTWLLGGIGCAAQAGALWYLILPVEFDGRVCGSAMSCVRLRALPGETLTAYDVGCHDTGVRIVWLALLAVVVTAAIIGAILVARRRQATTASPMAKPK